MRVSSDPLVTDRKTQFISRVTSAIKSLLQEKHLYQSVVIESADLTTFILIHEDSVGAKRTSETKTLNEMVTYMRPPWLLDPHPTGDVFQLKPPDVKLFCSTCKRIEPYNPGALQELFSRLRNEPFNDGGETEQVFVFSYQCQSCKGTPEIFLVRRKGFKLTNSGRSPIEHVDVPKDIAVEVRRFYGGALVAYQSGQTLAGVFLLRTLIEQWARVATGTTGFADAVIDAYMKSLPNDFKDRFPSMEALYRDLSADIHDATGSDELFNKACREIAQHFEARRVFKLKRVKKASATQQTSDEGAAAQTD